MRMYILNVQLMPINRISRINELTNNFMKFIEIFFYYLSPNYF